MDTKITIFTPTYNRAYIIGNLYHSLQLQSYKAFEWLVVDDGSDDDTNLLFAKWMKEKNDFNIRYYKTPNGGKHRAVNYGLDLANGEYFMVIDSDDYLLVDAVDKICEWLQTIEKDDTIVGVVANKGYSEFETPNIFFESTFLDKSLLEMNSYQEDGKKVLSGERTMCFRTAFHRHYKYPEFADEKFITEAVVYNRMAHDGFKMRFLNDIVCIYKYQVDGLSSSGGELYLKNPKGYGLWIREKADFEHLNIILRFQVYYAFYCDMKKYYDITQIAICLGVDKATIFFIFLIHKAITFVKENKSNHIERIL